MALYAGGPEPVIRRGKKQWQAFAAEATVPELRRALGGILFENHLQARRSDQTTPIGAPIAPVVRYSSLAVTDTSGLEAATKLVAATYYRRPGEFAYQAWEFVNATYFGAELPWPLITWGLTAHGGCLGYTASAADRSRPPRIQLHPSLLGGTEKENPWGISPGMLGAAFAFDTIVHEAIHVSVDYRLGGATGESSHNCAEWIAEVNRLAPLLGLVLFQAGSNRVRRVAVPDAPLTKRGKVQTKPVRQSDATLNGRPAGFDLVARFPRAVRLTLGQRDYYRRNALPFEHALQAGDVGTKAAERF